MNNPSIVPITVRLIVTPYALTIAIGSFSAVLYASSEKLFEDNTFGKLTTAAKKYLGADGTEVGIYGGSLPYDPTPTNPQISKFNVAAKTTADGKLSVDIEVKSAE